MTPEHKKQCEYMKSELLNQADDLRVHISEEDAKINTIHKDIKDIKENHLAHIQMDMATVKTNQDW